MLTLPAPRLAFLSLEFVEYYPAAGFAPATPSQGPCMDLQPSNLILLSILFYISYFCPSPVTQKSKLPSGLSGEVPTGTVRIILYPVLSFGRCPIMQAAACLGPFNYLREHIYSKPHPFLGNLGGGGTLLPSDWSYSYKFAVTNQRSCNPKSKVMCAEFGDIFAENTSPHRLFTCHLSAQ